MFSNDDTLWLPHDVRRALRVMFDRVAGLGLGPRPASIEIVEGSGPEGEPPSGVPCPDAATTHS
jgi:hypothetical protein